MRITPSAQKDPATAHDRKPSQCGPALNEPRDPQYWLEQPGAPKPKLDDEKPQGETVPYDELIKVWQSA